MGDGEGATINLPLPGDSGRAWWGLQLSAVLQLMLLLLAGYAAFRFPQLQLLLLAQACHCLSPIAVQATRPCWQPLMR